MDIDNKSKQNVPKTFVEALNVVYKSLKVIDWHSFMQ